MRKLKAFTLIEILIVVSILGILMGITLRGMGGVRQRAYDVEVKSVVLDTRMAAEVYVIDKGTYKDFTPTRSDLPACAGGGKPQTSFNSNYTQIAIYAPLCSQPGKNYCVDSEGRNCTTGATAATSGNCNCL
jgi:prepilin-type N-terminal cleavage/methylation domain-containing protein